MVMVFLFDGVNYKYDEDSFLRKDGNSWRRVNAVGKTHNVEEFNEGERVWVDLVGNLHEGTVSKCPKSPEGKFRVKVGVNDARVNLSQLVKYEDWQVNYPACPYPNLGRILLNSL